MTQSVNELSALTRLAAKGAGCVWGVAEEASYAIRWMLKRQLAGVEALASLLELNDGVDHRLRKPRVEDAHWIIPNAALCPLYAGIALNDHAEQLMKVNKLELGHIDCPVVLLPFVSQLCQSLNVDSILSWRNVRAQCVGATVSMDRDTHAALAHPAWQLERSRVTIQFCTSLESVQSAESALVAQNDIYPLEAGTQRSATDSACIVQLKALAHRTYAPATEASRILGAGAGLSDND